MMKHQLNIVFDTAFDRLGIDKQAVNVEVHSVGKRAIKRLNALHRGERKCTDVLSFPNLELKAGQRPSPKDFPLDVNPETGKLELGTIFICERVAKRQARKLNHSIQREVKFLGLHGLLHILGYTHDNDEDEEVMTKLQREILGDE